MKGGNAKENFVSDLWQTGKVVFCVFWFIYALKHCVNTVLFKLSLSRHLRLTKMNFCSTMPEAGFFQLKEAFGHLEFDLQNVSQFLCSCGRALPILKQS